MQFWLSKENELRRRLTSKPDEPAPPQREIGRSLLLVDDEPSIRLTLPPLLQENGFQVSVAANVPEALEAIKTNETSCAGSAPLGMKMGFSGENFERGSVSVVQAFVVGDCLKVVLTTL